MHRFFLHSKKILIHLLFICIFFDIYSIVKINSYCVSLFVLFVVFLLFYSGRVLSCVGVIDKNIGLLTIVFIFYILLNWLLSDYSNISSAFLIIFFLLGFIGSFYFRFIISDIYKEYAIKLFAFYLFIEALYVIYHFCSRNFFYLPLGDLWINGYMYEGYNWIGFLPFGDTIIYRATGTFLEPSFCGQFMSIGALLHFFIYQKNCKKIYLIRSFICLFSLVLTFSGSGFVTLLFCLFCVYFYNFFSGIISLKIRRFVFISIFIYSFCVLFFLFFTEYGSKFFFWGESRLLELCTPGAEVSGYQRFVGGFSVLYNLFKDNPLSLICGTGVGTSKYYKWLIGIEMNTNGLFRTLIEFGFLGLTYVFVLFRYILRNNLDNISLTMVYASAAMFFFCDFWTSHYIWFIIYFINIFTLTTRSKKKLS